MDLRLVGYWQILISTAIELVWLPATSEEGSRTEIR